MGLRRAGDGARASADRPLDRRGRGGLCLGETVGGAHRRGARAPRGGACRGRPAADAELAPRLEALYYLGWAETYLERYDDAVAHFERGIAIARGRRRRAGCSCR